jgi:hypothetical protein
MTNLNDYVKPKPENNAKKRIINGVWVESDEEIKNWKKI